MLSGANPCPLYLVVDIDCDRRRTEEKVADIYGGDIRSQDRRRGDEGAGGEASETAESNARLKEADGLLARGDYLAALACLRQLPTNGAADARVTERTLQLLLAGAATRDQAAALASEILAQDETSVPALLAQATVATERHDHARAAELWIYSDVPRCGLPGCARQAAGLRREFEASLLRNS